MKTVTFSVLSVVLHRGQVWRGLIYNSLQRRHTDRHLPQHRDSVPSDNLPPTARCHYFLHIGPFQGRKTRFDSPRVWAKSSNRPGPNWNPEVFGDGCEIRGGIITEILQEVVRIQGQELKTKASKSSPKFWNGEETQLYFSPWPEMKTYTLHIFSQAEFTEGQRGSFYFRECTQQLLYKEELNVKSRRYHAN